jgi:hypothetical protein
MTIDTATIGDHQRLAIKGQCAQLGVATFYL